MPKIYYQVVERAKDKWEISRGSPHIYLGNSDVFEPDKMLYSWSTHATYQSKDIADMVCKELNRGN